MKAIQITPYENVLVDVYRLATELKAFSDPVYRVGIHLTDNHLEPGYIICQCIGLKGEPPTSFSVWFNSKEELENFTEAKYNEICKDFTYRLKRELNKQRLIKIGEDFK